MTKRKGIPRDNLFRKTEISLQSENSQNNQVEKESITRQTYYIPIDLHKRLKIIAIDRNINLSDLVIEGVKFVVEKYETK